jgi:non-specific serine/threonine protein kinase
VAAALAVREEPGRSIEESIAKQLDGRELCVVLDNCEHVLGAAAQLAHALLATAPRLRLIATSREPLGYSGERVFPLGPMPTDSDAAELFRQRAVSATADFAVTPANAGAVARICSRLDGMPLALELAAALVAVMGVEDIDERLDEQLRLRMTGAVTAPERHRTLAALVRWSYGLLAPDEQMLFRRLAVFHGGFTLDGAERVCGGERRLDVMPALTALVRKSLVVKDEREGRARYSMLETIRQFALVELDASGEGQRIRGAHLAFYRDLAEEHEPLLADGRRQVAALDRLELELDNFRSAIATGLEPGGDETAAAEAAGALFALWYLRGYMSEGGRWLEATATAAMDSAPQAAAKALAGAGELAREQGDYALARERLRASLELARRDGITSGYGGVPFSLFNLGCTAWEEGEYGEARDLLEESLALCPHESEDAQFHVGWPLLKLGQVALDEGQPEAAMGLFERSLVRHRSRGDREGLARTLEQLGRAALARGDLRGARLLSERSIEAANELGYVEGLHGPLLNLARVDLHEGDTDGALERSREALTIVAQLGSRRGLAAALEATACVECARGGHERAATLFGAAAALREEIGSPVPGHLRDELDGAIAVARARCDTPSAAWAAGFSMSSDDARAFAVATS